MRDGLPLFHPSAAYRKGLNSGQLRLSAHLSRRDPSGGLGEVHRPLALPEPPVAVLRPDPKASHRAAAPCRMVALLMHRAACKQFLCLQTAGLVLVQRNQQVQQQKQH